MENVTFQHRKRAPTLGSAVGASRHFNIFLVKWYKKILILFHVAPY